MCPATHVRYFSILHGLDMQAMQSAKNAGTLDTVSWNVQAFPFVSDTGGNRVQGLEQLREA